MKDTHREGPQRLTPMFKGLALRSALVATTLLLGGPVAARAGHDHEQGPDDDNPAACSATSWDALTACHNDVRDDFWTTIGNCNNLSGDDAREACVADAKAAREEARGDCGDRFDAREGVCDALGQAPYDPQVDPDMFVDPANIKAENANPYFPLVPGTKWVWKTTADGEVTETVIDIIDGTTKEILGVTTIVVHDEVREGDSEDGPLVENTDDYYAQDVDGNVWYFGESSQELEDGEIVSIDGSWKAGRDFGKQGIQMRANPQVDDVYRQEFALREAEDLARVVSIDASETAGEMDEFSCDKDCVHTQDFTPLDPGTFEDKFYAPGVGVIVESNGFADPPERVELVEKTTIPVVSP
jgi:hypothetical protein